MDKLRATGRYTPEEQDLYLSGRSGGRTLRKGENIVQ